MGRPSDRDEVKRNLDPKDSFVDGQADMLAVLKRKSRSSVSSFCYGNEWIGKDSKGWFTTVFSLTAPRLIRAEMQRVSDAQSANGKKSMKGRIRGARGRVLPKTINGTLVPDDGTDD